MIYAFGEISGAHLNPAVSIGFWMSGRFERKALAPYIIAQCLGAIAASSLLLFLFPNNAGLGGTEPSGSVLQSFVMEVSPAAFKTDISRARTFGFLHEVEALHNAGLGQGGSLDNVVVVDGDDEMAALPVFVSRGDSLLK